MIFKRIKMAVAKLKQFVGKPLSEVASVDDVIKEQPADVSGDEAEPLFDHKKYMDRRLELYCHVKVIEFYGRALCWLGHRQAA